MEEIEVPSCFLCPISFDIMRDPVTLATGITYDRCSIERWIFSGKHHTCPVTKRPLAPEPELTPNHALRQLIQAWCTANERNGIERFPTPRPPADKKEVCKLLEEAVSPNSQTAALVKLKIIVRESDRNKQCVEACGGVDVLVSIIQQNASGASGQALEVLYSLQLSEQALVELASNKNADFIESLTTILGRLSSNYQLRAYAILLLKSILTAISPFRLAATKEKLFVEIVRVLRDQNSSQATKAALKILAWLCPWGTNRVKAAQAGAVPLMIERLLGEMEKAECETLLLMLDLMCGCTEGKVEMISHAAGIAVVSKKMLEVSETGTERSVRILHSLLGCSATPDILEEMLAVGAVSKLWVVLQADCGMKTKEKALEILRLHSRVWKNSPCLSPLLKASYPSD